MSHGVSYVVGGGRAGATHQQHSKVGEVVAEAAHGALLVLCLAALPAPCASTARACGLPEDTGSIGAVLVGRRMEEVRWEQSAPWKPHVSPVVPWWSSAHQLLVVPKADLHGAPQPAHPPVVQEGPQDVVVQHRAVVLIL